MKRVYASDVLAEVKHYQNLLDEAGIDCVLRNEQLAGALGEVPFLECQPELWVPDDAQARAEALIAEQRALVPGDAEAWRCARCGELNEPQFGACWRCGGEAP